jgi:ribosome-binding protein aMBF1 (putative translation factor)
MEPWQPHKEDPYLIEAIEEGKIVRVSEDYAKREGLLILRKPKIESTHSHHQALNAEEPRMSFDDFRKPLNWKTSQVYPDLIENFHWLISKRRRDIGLSRRQLASSLDEPENTLKAIENGFLPKDDFVIINKLQTRLGINLRKKRDTLDQPMRKLLDENRKIEKTKNQSEITGDDIELIEE